MKRAMLPLCALTLVLAIAFSSCASPRSTPAIMLDISLRDYKQLLQGDMPYGLRLTIYYIDANIWFRIPPGKDTLMAHNKIIIESEELAPYWKSMQEMGLSTLSTTQGECSSTWLGYTLENAQSQKLLEVFFCYDITPCVYVNDIPVAYDSQLFEIIKPFLDSGDYNYRLPH